MNRNRYQPLSEETRKHYEVLLELIRRYLPPGNVENVEEVANDVLSIVLGIEEEGVDVQTLRADKKKHLEALLDTPLTLDTANQLLRCGRLITDYVMDDALSEDSEADPQAGKHSDLSPFLVSSLGMSVEDGYQGESSFLDEVEMNMEGGSVPIAFEDVVCNPNYLKDTLRRLISDRSAEECAASAARVFDYLNAIHVDSVTVETQLSGFLLPFVGTNDDEVVTSWIIDVCTSRWDVVYGLRRARAGTEKERIKVMQDMEQHAKEDRRVELLYQRLTGMEVHKKPVEDDEGDEESGGGVMKRPLRYVNIQAYVFPEERAPHQHRQVRVPSGTTSASYPTHSEVTVPPRLHTVEDPVPLATIDSLPEWCRPTFMGIKQLNRMQSRVLEYAFQSDENMLISAPTGAGKTNVALLTMLRAIDQAKKSSGSQWKRELKMVYVAPMKALVQEVVRTFSDRLEPLELIVTELSGDASTSQGQLMNSQLIVATPEKWDIVTRKSVELGVAARLKLLILDEVHLLHNERGSVLEAIVARTFLQQHFRGQGGIRTVGLSATLPNWRDVASFLQVDLQKESKFVFDSSYRPVPLEQSFCVVRKEVGKLQTTTMNTVVYNKVIDAIVRDEQTLVFVHSRKDTAFTASFLKNRAEAEHQLDSILRPRSESADRLLEASQGNVNAALKALLPFGFGIHHAGLGKEERGVVENLFVNRHIKVLVCTSTLAWGVNFPANQVIIKGTRVFSAAKGKSELLSALDVLQMFGRAGRAGFGSSLGRAAILTSAEDVEYYMGILNQQLPIESHLMKRVVDMLNAEVVLGHIQNASEGVEWLKRTYLYARMKQEPELYGVEKSPNDLLHLYHLECIVYTCFEQLRKANMAKVRVHRQKQFISPTPYGRIASFYYVSVDSISAFLSNLSNSMLDCDLFHVFSLSGEFTQIPVRAEEQHQMRELIEKVPVAVADASSTSLAKINVLLQCYISRKTLEGLPLFSEIGYVKDSAQRILRALYEICVQKEFGQTARQFLELYQMVLHQQWAVESPIRQVSCLVSDKDFRAVLARVERIRFEWEELRQWSVVDWETALSSERRAVAAEQLVKAVPHFLIEASLRPLTRAMLYVDLDITPDFAYHPDSDCHSPPSKVTELAIFVEHMNGRILHSETIYLPLDSVVRQSPHSVLVVVPMIEPRPTHLMVRCVSPHWLHTLASTAVPLMNMKIPDVAPELKEATLPFGDVMEELDVGNVMAKYQLEKTATALFPFSQFYSHQRELVETIMECDKSSVFVGVPPGGGKTALAELFVLQFILARALLREDEAGAAENAGEDDRRRSSFQPKVLYLTVNEDVVNRRFLDWSCRLEPELGLKVGLLDGMGCQPASLEAMAKAGVNVLLATGFHLVSLIRREETRLLRDVTHIIVDHVHLLRGAEGRFMEECLARLNAAPFLVSNGAARARMLALSYPLISAVEVCQWLKIPTSRQFNFSNSCRKLLVDVEGVELPSARGRYESAVVAALKLLQRPQYACLPSVLFVHTEREAVDVATRVLLRCRGELPKGGESGVDDPRLALLLPCGVGYLHRRTSASDELMLLERLYSGDATHPMTRETVPLVLVCTYDVACRLPAAAFNLAVVTSTVVAAEADGATGPEATRHVTASELLQMVSRGSSTAVVYCPTSQCWTWRQILNEPLPLESALYSPEDFTESVTAAVVNGRVHLKEDILRVLRLHYFLYHLKSNPDFYLYQLQSSPHFSGKDVTTGISYFVTDLAGQIVKYLQERGCVRVEGEKLGEDNPKARLLPLSRGFALVRHGVSIQSCEAMDMELEGMLEQQMEVSVVSMWRVVASCCQELSAGVLGEAVQIGDNAERTALLELALALPARFSVSPTSVDFTKPGVKLFLLVLLHCARFVSPPDADVVHPFDTAPVPAEEKPLLLSIPLDVAMRLQGDLVTLLPVALRVLHGVVLLQPRVNVSGQRGSWLPVRCLMHLIQSVELQSWIGDLDSNEEVTAFEARGSVEQTASEMQFVVTATASLKAAQQPTDWWLSCVLTGSEGSGRTDDLQAEVTCIEEVRLEANTTALEVKLRFPLALLEDLDLNHLHMVAVLTSQSRRIDTETTVVC